MSKIQKIIAREILDSRGTPTIETDVILEDESFGRASVPSGASTGKYEATEKRDTSQKRYQGKGVLKVVQSINTKIASALQGIDIDSQMILDKMLCDLDGTPNKEKLGANAILSVSLAFAKAMATSHHLPLYRYIGGCHAHTLPIPMMNILNGGKHADNKIDVQEFMIMPIGANSIKTAIQMGDEVFMTLKAIAKQKSLNTNVGDEGGLAPQLSSSIEALDLIMESIHQAGFKESQIGLALDVASSELYDNHLYHLSGENKTLTAEQMIEYYRTLIHNYPILSIEDPMAEDDWDGWKMMTETFGHHIQLVGDDLFTTNVERLKKGIQNHIANAILIKPNQIGTLTETLNAIEVAQKSGYKCIISHRSGETEDTTITDLAVGTNVGQIKTGSLSRTDRLAKYNQLIRIEEELGSSATFGDIR